MYTFKYYIDLNINIIDNLFKSPQLHQLKSRKATPWGGLSAFPFVKLGVRTLKLGSQNGRTAVLDASSAGGAQHRAPGTARVKSPQRHFRHPWWSDSASQIPPTSLPPSMAVSQHKSNPPNITSAIHGSQSAQVNSPNPATCLCMLANPASHVTVTGRLHS